jgi:copper(I)-binding protein
MRMPTLLVLAGLPLLAAVAAQARDFTAGDVVIREPWSRATPRGATTAAGYLSIENRGSAPDRLISGTSPAAERFEVHEMTMTDGIMRMRPVQGGVALAPGATVQLQPGGYHIMLIGLKEQVKEGATVPATLTFEKAGKVDIQFDVRGMGAGGAQKHGH